MLFLFYIILTLIFCIIIEAILLTLEIIDIANGVRVIQVGTFIRAIGFIIQIAFFIVISNFFKFHVELVLSNSSTLDNLERQRNPNVGQNVYDVGPY